MKNLIRKILKESEWFEELDLGPANFLHDKLKGSRIQRAGSRYWPDTKWSGWTRYVDSNGKVIFMENNNTRDKQKTLYINRGINTELVKMGLNYDAIKKLCLDVFREVYNLDFEIFGHFG